MQIEKNLLRRFNGSRAQIEAYCAKHKMTPEDLNYQYWEAWRHAKQTKFHKLRR